MCKRRCTTRRLDAQSASGADTDAALDRTKLDLNDYSIAINYVMDQGDATASPEANIRCT